MTALAPIADRLAKLVPLLSSNQPGEVFATAQAIGRTLTGAGLDWHDFTAAITVPATVRPEPEIIREPQTWHELCDALRNRFCDLLTTKEFSFVSDMWHRTWGNGQPTEKQANWLRGIWAKVQRIRPDEEF